MKLRVVLAAVSMLAAASALAQAPSDPKEAVEPVMKQLEALRRDDYDTAYTFASASIQEMFDRAADSVSDSLSRKRVR